MGILDEVNRLKRKVKSTVKREVLGEKETKGQRWNRRRMRMAQEAWRYYNGPMSRSEFMSQYLKSGPARSKDVLKRDVGKWDKKALDAGKKLTVDDICKLLLEQDLRRTPSSEQSFVDTIQRRLPGGLREYGEFKFAGTIHRPDFYINKNIVFEFKIIHSNTELHTGIGQALIYTHEYPTVFLIIYDARQGYDAVELSKHELNWLYSKGVLVVKYPFPESRL